MLLPPNINITRLRVSDRLIIDFRVSCQNKINNMVASATAIEDLSRTAGLQIAICIRSLLSRGECVSRSEGSGTKCQPHKVNGINLPSFYYGRSRSH